MFLSIPLILSLLAGGCACLVWMMLQSQRLSSMRERNDHLSAELDRALEQDAEDTRLVEAVLRASEDAILVVDGAGACIMANACAASIFERSGSCQGITVLGLSHSAELDALLRQAIADLPKTGAGGTVSGEVVLWAFHGVVLQAIISRVDLADRPQHGGIYVMVLRDVTELRRLSTMRRDFVANVSHELRTPLSSVQVTAETLLDGALEDEQMARHFLNTIVREAGRLVRLADDLLELSRIESMAVTLSECDLAPLIEDLIARFRSQISKANLVVETDLRGSRTAQCDADELAQVLLNLIDNAIKYTQSGGHVGIKARRVEGWVVIEVSDTGIGILQQDIPRLFERFYRTDKARSRQSGGTGLGLAIVKHIVERHNGELWVRSDYNHGSTFGFAIPVSQTATERPQHGFELDREPPAEPGLQPSEIVAANR